MRGERYRERYVIVPLTDEEGCGYIAYAANMPGCVGDGETPAEALADLENAKREWLAAMERLGRDAPF